MCQLRHLSDCRSLYWVFLHVKGKRVTQLHARDVYTVYQIFYSSHREA
jgi:hypothetical protein